MWVKQRDKLIIQSCNIKEKETSNGTKFWYFPLQYTDKDKDMPFCPLGQSVGELVSGFGYVALNDKVIKALRLLGMIRNED